MKKLFGNHIKPDCRYCHNFVLKNGSRECEKDKQIKRDKCSKFNYDPLKRVPLGEPELAGYSKEDFDI